jgi:hypothetical protein
MIRWGYVYQEIFSNSNLKRKILIPDTTLDTTRYILWIRCAVVGCWKLGLLLLRPDKSDANSKHSFTLLSFTTNPNLKHSFMVLSSFITVTRHPCLGGWRLQAAALQQFGQHHRHHPSARHSVCCWLPCAPAHGSLPSLSCFLPLLLLVYNM